MTKIYNRELISREEQLSEEREKVARLRGDLSELRGEFAAISVHLDTAATCKRSSAPPSSLPQ